MVKKLRRYVKPFSSHTGTSRTGGQTELLYQYRALVCWRAIKTNILGLSNEVSVTRMRVVYVLFWRRDFAADMTAVYKVMGTIIDLRVPVRA